ncbi:radical SAM protein [Oscillatoria sp. CS-180]|uniref:radical SAM protein n=1 Tax=Oscillatoria sp. CS-180 TaxID=3021720 RepID=UPI00232C7F3F|nr:radical SAM protein [Oscillatoria sp. CS-180]MDB9527957.1 radical SAM protein [Oscillatoria sp. CS-180]
MLKKIPLKLAKAFSIPSEAVIIEKSGLLDNIYYLSQNADVRNENISPVAHYIHHGAEEGRNPSPFFDTLHYFEQNPELAAKKINPLAHYIKNKQQNPNAYFNSQSYLNAFPELWKSALSPLCHFVLQFQDEQVSFIDLLRKVVGADDFDKIVQPLLQEIFYVYRTFLFREPSKEEVLSCIEHYYKQVKTFETRIDVVKNGNPRTFLNIRPLNLEMDIVNQCNLRCIMCHFSDVATAKRKKTEMSVENFHKVADRMFPLCSEMSLSISTEPLLHSEFGQLLKITKDYQVPTVRMYTNGLLLNKKTIAEVIHGGLDQICISIDGATKKTYEYVRVGAKFEKLISNIKALNQAKEAASSPTPHIGFGIVIMRSNIEELPTLMHLAHELKVEAVSAVHMVPLSEAVIDYNKESLESHKELCNTMLDEARDLASKYGISVVFPEKFDLTLEPISAIEIEAVPQTVPSDVAIPELPIEPMPEVVSSDHSSTEQPSGPGDLVDLSHEEQAKGHVSIQNMMFNFSVEGQVENQPCCSFPWHFVGLQPDGYVVPCGWWYNEPPLGNVFDDSFETIWNNPNYEKLRSELLTGSLRKTCQTCPVAGMGDVNNASSFIER